MNAVEWTSKKVKCENYINKQINKQTSKQKKRENVYSLCLYVEKQCEVKTKTNENKTIDDTLLY